MTYRKPLLVPFFLFPIWTILLTAWCVPGPLEGRTDGASPGETLEIARGWAIYLPASPHQALSRAARDLQTFLKERHRLDLEIHESSQGRGIYLVAASGAKDDRFSVRAIPREAQIIIEGSSPRAVYQGVFFLEDQLAEGPRLSASLDRTVIFPFRDRYLIWDALLTGQNKGAIGFDLERHVREAVRLGYSGMECNRFMGMELLQHG